MTKLITHKKPKKRKYYKNEASADAIKIVVDFICPNTKNLTSIEIKSSQLAGAHNDITSMVSARINCKECNRIHFISLKG